MGSTWNAILWDQFGAAIDTLEDTLRACPDELWRGRIYEERKLPPEFTEFWFVAYHVLFWLDFYLSETREGFVRPPRSRSRN